MNPEAFTTGAHFAISAAVSLASSSGVLLIDSCPSLSSRARTSGICRTSIISRLRRVMIVAEAQRAHRTAGNSPRRSWLGHGLRKIAHHDLADFTPDSAAVFVGAAEMNAAPDARIVDFLGDL